jgi:hypothetical protein
MSYTTSSSSGSSRWSPKVDNEINKLRNRDTAWNLVGGLKETRTRPGGNRMQATPTVLFATNSSFETSSLLAESPETNRIETLDEVSSSLDSSYEQLSESSSEEEFVKPDPFNLLLVESKMLVETIESNSVCCKCGGPVLVYFTTITLATCTIISCMDTDS